MPAGISIPDGLRMVLARFRPHFSRPGFEVFTAMLVGHLLAPVGRTVCGMLTAAGLAEIWHHARAHRFFASTRWNVRQVGLNRRTLVRHLAHRPGPGHPRPQPTPANPPPGGYDVAIVTTDLTSTVDQVTSRYASRWAIEVAFHDAKNTTGIGETRNRVTIAVERTVPFTFMCQSITARWYTTNADPETQISQRRRRQPWYTTKTAPSAFDMLLALRAAILTARITPITPDRATSEQPQHSHVTTYPAAS